MDVKKISPWLNDYVIVTDDNGNTATGTLEMTARKEGQLLYRIKGNVQWWTSAEKVKG